MKVCVLLLLFLSFCCFYTVTEHPRSLINVLTHLNKRKRFSFFFFFLLWSWSVEFAFYNLLESVLEVFVEVGIYDGVEERV